jgi:YidC/Oxa1 family membrane protein insertase
MKDDNGRNTILFVVITVIFLVAYQFLVLGPQAEQRKAALQVRAESAATGPARPAGEVGSAAPAAVKQVRKRFHDRREEPVTAARSFTAASLLAFDDVKQSVT